MTDYTNILNALGKSASTLTIQQQNANFDAYRKLTDNGVSIPDLLEKLKTLEEKVDKLEKPKEETLDSHLFEVMANSVKDDPLVIEAKKVLQAEKTRVITELCIADEGYRKAFQRFKQIVNQQYIGAREKGAETTE